MSMMFNAPVGVIDQYAQALRRIDKPWGYEIVWALTADYCGKMLFVEAGHRLSLQFHRRKDETIYLHSGQAREYNRRPGDRSTVGMSMMFNAPVGVIDQYAQALRRIDKPWGYEIVWALTSDYCGKILFVEAGHRLSLQFHRRKDETIYLHSGLAQIHIGDPAEAVGPATISPGRSFHIPPGVIHRIEAIEDSLLFEVSTPHLDDVVRIEDAYGRGGSAALVADT